MKKQLNAVKWIVIAASLIAWIGGNAHAGVPLTAIEGAGGIAFNPLAYVAGQNKGQADEAWAWKPDFISKPQFGFWYVNLGDIDADWVSHGAAFSVFDRLEFSYSHEVIAPDGKNIHKNNVGTKLLLVPENAGGKSFVPAIAAGAIFKQTSDVADGVDNSAVDFYGVATKLITALPAPVLLSGGLRSSRGYVNGVFGYDDERDVTLFGNANVILSSKLTLGLEFEQGSKFDSFENANHWNANLAWLYDANLTLVLAYVNGGDHESTSEVGLGDGVVLSAQYAF
ncbi:MAG: hypothetical protein BWY59_02446 [Verrucomicrobia bacterium ADurb.Bin345]|nr:MAG: hypothetical protein BWY59_02446 [Verrucomicrobia bacterium ADurb.Bin345]